MLALINTTCVCVGRGDRVLPLIKTTCVCVVKEDKFLHSLLLCVYLYVGKD